jgi:hypothetical protein
MTKYRPGGQNPSKSANPAALDVRVPFSHQRPKLRLFRRFSRLAWHAKREKSAFST